MFLAVVAFMLAGVYAGRQQSILTEQAVTRRLADMQISSIVLTRSRRDSEHGLEFVCGIADVRDASGAEKTVLFGVVFKGAFPSVVGTFLDTDPEFNYTAFCGPH